MLQLINDLLELMFYILTSLAIAKYLGWFPLPKNLFKKKEEEAGIEYLDEIYKGRTDQDTVEAESLANLYPGDKNLFNEDNKAPDGTFSTSVDMDTFASDLYSSETGVEY